MRRVPVSKTLTTRGTTQWVATKEEADALALEKSKLHWGVFVTKVNKANRRHLYGYVVSWRESKGKS